MIEKLPSIMYGTAWKEEKTKDLVKQAIQAGFSAIDTANQPRHYSEALVGEAISESGVKREELFLQTKFTHRDGQDDRIPYNPDVAPEEQVLQSFESSLEHLKTDYIDSYLIHGPSNPFRISGEDLQVWKTIVSLKKQGKIRYAGVSNFRKEQLEELWNLSEDKPDFIQNRCYASLGWDRLVRRFCREKKIIYQGFSLLTANTEIVHDLNVKKMSIKYQKTAEQIVFRFAVQSGMIPLSGTTNPLHMKQDLDIFSFHLNEKEMGFLENR